MSSSDRIRLSAVKEVTLGVTPASPALQILRPVSESLNYNISNVSSAQLIEDRSQADLIQVGADASGDVNGELSFNSWKTMIESSLANPFVLGVATNGITMISMTVVKQYLDLSGVQHIFKGMTVESFTLNISKQSLIKVDFKLMGTVFTDVMPATPTFVPAATTESMNSSSNVTSIMFDGVPMTSCVDSLTMTIKNNLRPRDCVGSMTHTDFTFGRCEITGDIDVYFQDTILYNKYKNGQAFSLDFTITDAANNSYAINMPRVKFDKLSTVAGGTNQDIMAKGSYRALKDASHMVRITASPA